jgi:HSP20 family protein
MSLIRYQIPELTAWRSFNRWSHLRDDLNTLFELPSWSNFGREGQLFSGWSPALDLYQNNDDVMAVVELPGMRKEDIEISLHDGTLTIARRTEDRKFQRGEGGTLRALYR